MSAWPMQKWISYVNNVFCHDWCDSAMVSTSEACSHRWKSLANRFWNKQTIVVVCIHVLPITRHLNGIASAFRSTITRVLTKKTCIGGEIEAHKAMLISYLVTSNAVCLHHKVVLVFFCHGKWRKHTPKNIVWNITMQKRWRSKWHWWKKTHA